MAVIFPISANSRINGFLDEVSWDVLAAAIAAEWDTAVAGNPYGLSPDMNLRDFRDEVTVSVLANYFKTFEDEPPVNPAGQINTLIGVNRAYDVSTLSNMIEYFTVVGAISIAPPITAMIWASMGDSTMEGVIPGEAEDLVVIPGVYQVKFDNSITNDMVPMDTQGGGHSPGTDVPSQISQIQYFAKRAYELTGLPQYIIGCAVAGGSVLNATQWAVGGGYQNGSKTRINSGIVAVQAAVPGAVFMGIVEEVGENDGGYGDPTGFGAAMAARKPDMRNALYKNGFSGDKATDCLWVHSLMQPIYIGGGTNGQLMAQAIRKVSGDDPYGRLYCPPWNQAGLTAGDGLHPTPLGCRIQGPGCANAALTTTPCTFSLPAAYAGSDRPFKQLLTASSEDVWWTVTGPDAALFEVIMEQYEPSTYFTTEASRTSFFLQFVGGATHTLASPGDANGDGVYDITINAKAGNGVVTSHAHPVTLVAAYGTGDTGSATFTSVDPSVTATKNWDNYSFTADLPVGDNVFALSAFASGFDPAAVHATVNGVPARVLYTGPGGGSAKAIVAFEVYGVPLTGADVVLYTGGTNLDCVVNHGVLQHAKLTPYASGEVAFGDHSGTCQAAVTVPSGGVAFGNTWCGAVSSPVSGCTADIDPTVTGAAWVQRSTTGNLGYTAGGWSYLGYLVFEKSA